MTANQPGRTDATSGALGAARSAVAPRTFATRSADGTPVRDEYLDDPALRKLIEFFEAKTLAVLKDEDRREQWYDDWIEYQAEHRIYASVLSPRAFSTRGAQFDPLRFARFIEVFAYCSPAHGYSAQVTFLGLFSILMGENDALKREAVAALEAGKLIAFAVSEREHGADLLANEFTITPDGHGNLVANGSKFYIGNSNAAAIIAVLARRAKPGAVGQARRTPSALFALRPAEAPGFRNVGRVRTLGVRAGHVGHFEVRDHPLPESDVIAAGRGAWDAVLGSVTLGKFFLGFGSIGICEHALQESVDHVGTRRLYGRPVIEMPHIRALMSRAHARITAMKLFAFRALDYVQAAHAEDRRYQLFCAVQKAKVSTEGVRVMSLLSECVGARGFDSETYFEMALRDIQLIPGLESSTHINLATAARFGPRYFDGTDGSCVDPGSLLAGEAVARENPWLMDARTGRIENIAFADCMVAYAPLRSIRNVRLFARQVERFRDHVVRRQFGRPGRGDEAHGALDVAHGLAAIVYGHLVAENAARLDLDAEMINVIFHLLVEDLSAAALTLGSGPGLDGVDRRHLRHVVALPRTSAEEWEFVARRLEAS